MDDALLVRRLERLGDLARDRQHVGQGHARGFAGSEDPAYT